MKKYRLHICLPLLLLMATLYACNQKEFPGSNNSLQDEMNTSNNAEYIPPQVIVVPDEKTKTNKDGEMYYDDEYGFRYWRSADGKYYLDSKYAYGAKPNKKLAAKSNKNQVKKNQRNTDEVTLAHQ
ncbi:MAG: hypothetical protein JST86_20360 [Bacteroidetes bacterium]|nr:hypothetical protein [Bacteroidota bacterium]